MVPRQPHQTLTIAAQARRGVEVVARDQHALLPTCQVYAHYLVYGFVPGVVLPYGDEAAAVPIYDHVGVSSAGIRGEQCRFAARGRGVDSLVGEVREVDRASVEGEAASAVFVHPRAHVERLRRNVLGSSVRGQEHDDVAPALAGPALQPVHVPTIDHYFRQPHYAPDDQVRGDRRPPGTVGRDSTFGHSSALRGFSVGGLEDQPRALETLTYRLAPPAGYHAHEPIPLADEVLERLLHLRAVQNEDHPMVLGELLYGLASRLFCPYGFGPQPAPARVGLGLEGGIPLAPIFHALLDPVQYPLYGGPAVLAHHQPPLSVCPSVTHSTPVSSDVPDFYRDYALSR